MFLNFTEVITLFVLHGLTWGCCSLLLTSELFLREHCCLLQLLTQPPGCNPNWLPNLQSKGLTCRIPSCGYYSRQAVITIYNGISYFKFPEEKKKKPTQNHSKLESPQTDPNPKSSWVTSNLTLPPYVQNGVEYDTAWKLHSFLKLWDTAVIKFC